MNTKIVLVVLLAIIVIGGAWYALANHASAPVETATTTPVNNTVATSTETQTPNTSNTGSATTGTAPAPAATHKTVTVTYGDQGFSPKSVSIAIGDTVKFVNQSSHGMWVASDAHPVHSEYDGTTLMQHCANGTDTKGGFDECASIPSGQSYSFTFPKAGTFQYHNHVRASDTGTITVK